MRGHQACGCSAGASPGRAVNMILLDFAAHRPETIAQYLSARARAARGAFGHDNVLVRY